MSANSKAYANISRLARVILLLLVAHSASPGSTPQGQVPPFKITAMKAMLFYENSGEFSPDVAGNDDGPILWNTPLEGTSRPGASSSLLVTVAVTGEYSNASPRKIEFSARYIPLNRSRREIVVTRTVSISIGEGGNFIAGFWLYDTGCNPLKLSARIVGQRETARMKKIINFRCGE